MVSRALRSRRGLRQSLRLLLGLPFLAMMLSAGCWHTAADLAERAMPPMPAALSDSVTPVSVAPVSATIFVTLSPADTSLSLGDPSLPVEFLPVGSLPVESLSLGTRASRVSSADGSLSGGWWPAGSCTLTRCRPPRRRRLELRRGRPRCRLRWSGLLRQPLRHRRCR